MADVTTPFGFPYPEPTDLVRDGATDIEALAQAANDQFAAGFQFAGQRIYTSSGTFAKADPFGNSSFDGAKMRAIRVRMVGGGGGGGGAGTVNDRVGGGGGGGGYAEKFITNIAGLSASETITRGGGGAGSVSGTTAGSFGGQSSAFGVSANGGQQGSASTSAPAGAGGTAFTGDLNIPGGTGDFGAISGAVMTTGGGGSHMGQGAQRILALVDETGGVGVVFGGGGGGGLRKTGDANGGAGAEGIVIVDVFA